MAGLVHIYTGDGKGKTTAAIGLAIRASGNGLKVLMVQFLKGAETGEVAILKQLEPNFKLCRREEIKAFFWNANEEQKRNLRKYTHESLKYCYNLISTEEWDMLILDEVMGAISVGFIVTEDIVHFLKNKPDKLEVVLTGRDAPEELVEIADYVSEITPVKHPFCRGIAARKGIEF